MAKTLNSVADRVTSLLQNDYKDRDTLAAFVSGAAACKTLTVTDGRKYEIGDKLEAAVSAEVMYVIEAPKETDFLNESATLQASITGISVETSGDWSADDFMKADSEELKVAKVSVIGSANMKVTRGVRGTTATEHDKTVPLHKTNSILVRRAYAGSTAKYQASASVINIVDGWTKYEIIENIKRELESLFPVVSRDFLGETVGDTNRKQVDDCDTASNWTEADDAVTPTDNTTDEKEGTGCCNLGTTFSAGTGSYSQTLAATFDGSDYDYLNLWFYVEDLFDDSDDPYLNNDALEVRVGNDSSNYLSIKVGRDELRAGHWTLLNLPIAEFTETGTVDKTALDYFEIVVSAPQSITLGNIKMDEWFMTTYPMTTTKMKYRLPTGVRHVSEVRILNDEGSTDYKYGRSFTVDEKYLFFAKPPPTPYPMVIRGQKQFTIPSANTTTLDMEDDLEELLILGAGIRCIEQKLMEVLRSDKLSTRINENYPLYLDREKRRLRERYKELKDMLSDSLSAMGDWFDHG